MATDPRFDPQPTYTEAPPKEKSGCASCMTGCGIVALILVILLVIGGILLWVYGKGMFANMMAQGLSAAVDETALPAEEKQQMKEQVNRLTDAFKGGQLSWAELGPLMEKIVESPVITTLIVSFVEKQNFDKSGLSDEEKAEGHITLLRFQRGLIDKKIDDKEFETVMLHIADRKDGQWQLRQNVSDEELRKFLAAAKEAADKAEVPAEPEAVDPSDELKRIIDEALKE